MLTPQFWIQSLWLAFSQIWANKTRSVLTALGIIVGVASVTAVIAALSGLKAKVLTEFESFGANRVFIFPNRPDDAPRNKYPWESVRLKPSEAIELRDQATSLKALTPIVEISGAVESDSKKLDSMQIVGIWPDWHPIEGRRVIMGRAFGQVDEDNARQVCLVNDRAIEELRLPNDPTGTTLLVAGRRFLVVGVVETLQSRMFGFDTQASGLEQLEDRHAGEPAQMGAVQQAARHHPRQYPPVARHRAEQLERRCAAHQRVELGLDLRRERWRQRGDAWLCHDSLQCYDIRSILLLIQ